MPRLSWRSAVADHREALSRFVCADPENWQYDRHRGRHHPRPYEHEAQSHLRGLDLPVAPGEALALGFDDVGIAAAIHFGFTTVIRGEAEQFVIMAVACARRCAGLGYGGQAIDLCLDSLRATKEQAGLDCGVFARIDPRNDGSRALFGKKGFEYLDVFQGLEVWVRDV